MNPTKASSLRLSRTERHEFVVLGVRAGKSNRAIAKELGVDEGTIRRDRKFLETPEVKRPMTVPPPKTSKKEWPVRELSPDESRRRQLQGILKAAQLWVTQTPSLTRPTYAVEDYMPAMLGFYAEWLARWLACCLPGEEELQDEVLRQISIRARS